jgi:hypothetical protein
MIKIGFFTFSFSQEKKLFKFFIDPELFLNIAYFVLKFNENIEFIRQRREYITEKQYERKVKNIELHNSVNQKRIAVGCWVVVQR